MAAKKTKPAVQNTDLRDSLLASSTGKAKLAEVEIEGVTYFLRKPKVTDRSRILVAVQKCQDDEEKMALSQIHCLISFAVDESGNPLFKFADMEMIRGMHAGSVLDLLGIEALNLLNVDGMVKSAEKKA